MWAELDTEDWALNAREWATQKVCLEHDGRGYTRGWGYMRGGLRTQERVSVWAGLKPSSRDQGSQLSVEAVLP